MAYIDEVVDVTVVLGTQPIDTVGFETPMFLAIHNTFPERIRAYTTLDQLVSDGFAPGSAAHTFASKAFAGIFAPSILMIGRQGYTGTVIDFTGTENVDPDEVVALNIYSGSYKGSIIVTPSSTSTPSSIAADLATAISNDATLASVITVTSNGAVVTISPVAGETVSVGIDSGNMKLTNTTGETVSSVLPQVLQANGNWYFLSTESHTNASILSAASYAAANYKMHVYSTADEESKVVGGDSIANQLKALSYDTSIGMYDPLANSAFPEGGIIGASASNDPSYGDSLHLKTMDGVIAPSLSPTDRMNIWGQNLNFYREQHGENVFWEGLVASGQYFDTIRFGHWMKFRSEESLFGHMYRRSNLGLSVKMSDDDLAGLKGVLMNNPINVGIRNGAILTGYDETNKVFYDPVISIPTRASIPTNDLAARVLNNVKVELIYNNSLHFIKMRITVLTDATSATLLNAQASTSVSV